MASPLVLAARPLWAMEELLGPQAGAGLPLGCEPTLREVIEAASEAIDVFDFQTAAEREAGVVALGLLGKPEARDVLEKVLKDTDPLVRGNAEAALRMLAQGGGAGAGAPKVIRSVPDNFANDVAPDRKTVSITFDRKMRRHGLPVIEP